MAKKSVRVASLDTFNDDIFVLKHKKNYRLLRASSEKAIKVTNSKKKAVDLAKIIQAKVHSDIFVMDDKGKLLAQYACEKSVSPIKVSSASKKPKGN